jgi:hypothetical protein
MSETSSTTQYTKHRHKNACLALNEANEKQDFFENI